jgi:hypothetical protein
VDAARAPYLNASDCHYPPSKSVPTDFVLGRERCGGEARMVQGWRFYVASTDRTSSLRSTQLAESMFLHARSVVGTTS